MQWTVGFCGTLSSMEPFAHGMKDRQDGAGLDANPFVQDSDEWINWRRGWLVANSPTDPQRSDRLKTQRSERQRQQDGEAAR